MSAAEKNVVRQLRGDPIDIAGMARRALQENGGDVLAATKSLEAQAKKNTAIWKALTEKALPECCYNEVRAECRRRRWKISTAANYTAGGNGERVTKHAHSLMDFPLPGGMPLREARAKDLYAAAAFYAEQASDMSHKARWLERISDELGRKKVGNALTVQQLQALWEQTQ